MGDDIRAAQKELAGRVLGKTGVTGIAVGKKGGRPCLTVYLRDGHSGRGIPKSVRGHPVVVEKSGGFERY